MMILNDITWEKSLIRSNTEINNSESTISDNRTQPQISGAFLFLTKFRNSVYFLNNVYCFFQRYTMPCRFVYYTSKNGGNILNFTEAQNCLSIEKKLKTPVSS